MDSFDYQLCLWYSVFYYGILIMKWIGRISLLVLLVLALCGCIQRPTIKIDRGAVKVEQGRYTGETIDLVFYADLTPPIGAGMMADFTRAKRLLMISFSFTKCSIPLVNRTLKQRAKKWGHLKQPRFPFRFSRLRTNHTNIP